MAKKPNSQLWQLVSVGILKKIRKGELVLPSVSIREDLPGSYLLAPPTEILKVARRKLNDATTQHERAVWQQAISSLPSSEGRKWGFCQYCGEPYELQRSNARSDCCRKEACLERADKARKQADARRKKEEYHSSPGVRSQKIAAVLRRRAERIREASRPVT